MRRRLLAIGSSAFAAVSVAALWIGRPRIQYCADGMNTETGEPWGYCGDATVSEGAVVGTIAVVALLAVFLVTLFRARPPLRARLLVVVSALLVIAPVVGGIIAISVDPFGNGIPPL